MISGNIGSSLYIYGAGTNDNVVAGNLIGTDATGMHALDNGIYQGIVIRSGARSNLIGTNGDGISDAAERNVISGHPDAEVWIG